MFSTVFYYFQAYKETKDYNNQFEDNRIKLETVEITISNPNVIGKNIAYIREIVYKELVVSRIRRENILIVASEKETIQAGDVLYGVLAIKHIDKHFLKTGQVVDII